MEKQKISKAQVERRIKNALVFVPKDKEYKGIYFDDKGVRLECTDDYCVISTFSHSHVFHKVTSSGYSRPYIYTSRMIDIAIENNCEKKDRKGHVTRAYDYLLDVLQKKEDKSEYNIAVYYSWYLYNLFQPLYGIGETDVDAFLVYEDYIHNIARNSVILDEKKEDMTNKQFISKTIERIGDFTKELEENVVFQRLTDEERMKQEVDAIQEQEQEQAMEAQINEGQD